MTPLALVSTLATRWLRSWSLTDIDSSLTDICIHKLCFYHLLPYCVFVFVSFSFVSGGNVMGDVSCVSWLIIIGSKRHPNFCICFISHVCKIHCIFSCVCVCVCVVCIVHYELACLLGDIVSSVHWWYNMWHLIHLFLWACA